MRRIRSISCVAATAVSLLIAIGGHAAGEPAAVKDSPPAPAAAAASAESYAATATLTVVDVSRKGKSPRVRLRLRNLSDGVVVYDGSAKGSPAWRSQRSVAGAWTDARTSPRDGAHGTHELAPGEAFKFDATLDASAAPTRFGVNVVDRATGHGGMVWSETVYGADDSPP